MRSAQTDPSIGVHIEPSPTEDQLFMLVVENHGMGPASDLQFEVVGDSDTPELALKFLRNLTGMDHLAPGQRITAFYGSAIELLNKEGKGFAKLKVSFRRPTGDTVMREFTLDPGRFEGMPFVGSNYSRKLADSVEEISKTLAQVVYGSRLQVTTQTREEQKQERDAFAERARARRQNPAGPASEPSPAAEPPASNSAETAE